MYAKIIDGVVKKYPYSVQDLKKDNPNTSFPNIFDDETLAQWDVLPVKRTTLPQYDWVIQNLVEQTPQKVNTEWVQVWSVVPATPEEVAERRAQERDRVSSERLEAYRNESDPLLFKAQRGEATMQEWLAKIDDIKQRYPK
jgi:hypothetical protein